MAKNPKQKQKLLYILKFFMEKTDEDYGVTGGCSVIPHQWVVSPVRYH